MQAGRTLHLSRADAAEPPPHCPGPRPQVLCLSGDRVYRHGMLHGFGPWAWAVVGLQAVGGLVVSLVVKYTDNIIKASGSCRANLLALLIALRALLVPVGCRSK